MRHSGQNILFAIIFLMAVMVGMEHAQAVSVPTCDQFKSRLAQAEGALQKPVPRIKFLDKGAFGSLHEYDLEVQGIEAHVNCRPTGQFDVFDLTLNDDHDDYTLLRAWNLMAAATWAFTQWPPAKALKSFDQLVANMNANLRDARIRGEKDEGRADIDLADDVNIVLWGGKDFGIHFMIDASTAK